ncbi:MAG: bi-domain-containing oxidoreductase, partial [Rhodospirillales bacterium]
QGDTALSKERIEAYAGGAVMVIDDFKNCTVAQNGQVKNNGANAGKGIPQELKAFIAAAQGGEIPIDESELIETSIATIAALESLQSGDRVTLS